MPLVQFPATSRIAIPLFLAVITWVIFNYLGIKRQGFVGYFKTMMFPPGVPKPVYILLAPIEFASTVYRAAADAHAATHVQHVRRPPGAAAVHPRRRVPALEYGGAVGLVAGSVSLLGSIVLTFFEGFVQILQAYVFTLLTALYIGGALPTSTDPPRSLPHRTHPCTEPHEPREEHTMNGSLNMVGYGLAAIGPGIGVGLIFAAYINGVARQPEARSVLQPIAILGFALAEALAIIGIGLAFAL